MGGSGQASATPMDPSRALRPPSTYGAQLARFWMTLAISVRARAGPGAGCSGARPKRLGARMAGHRSRRKREAHTRRGPSASEPRALHASRQPENTVPSSAGNQLGKKSQWSEREREGMGMDDQSPQVRDQESPALWVSRLQTSGS